MCVGYIALFPGSTPQLFLHSVKKKLLFKFGWRPGNKAISGLSMHAAIEKFLSCKKNVIGVATNLPMFSPGPAETSW